MTGKQYLSVLVLSIDNYGNLDELLSKLKKRIKEIVPDLELRKAFTPLDKEKLEILKFIRIGDIGRDDS